MMTRQEQRELGAIAMSVSNLIQDNRSTKIATIHASADMMEHLELSGAEIFRDFPAGERRKMAKSGQAMPDGSYPIANCADAANAIHAVGRAKNPDAVKAWIKRRVRALNCSGTIYDNWK